jgi:hypothetical protein
MSTRSTRFFLGQHRFVSALLILCVVIIAAISMTFVERQWQGIRLRRQLSNPLVDAAIAGDDAAVERLLKQGADPNSREVVDVGLIEQINYWLDVRTSPPEDQPDDLRDLPTALTEAAANGHEKVVQLLLAHGANPDLKSKHFNNVNMGTQRQTALEWAKQSRQWGAAHILEQAEAGRRRLNK